MPNTFKPKPKHGDLEERIVTAINSTDQAVVDMIVRIEGRPVKELKERRIYLNGQWADWKKLPRYVETV